jgi:hypothetical protein
MLAMKPAAALLILGLGGMLGAGAPVPTSAPAESSTLVAPAEPNAEALQAAVVVALAPRVRADLADATAAVDIGPLTLVRASLRSLEARGAGDVRVPGSRPIPIQVIAVFDMVDQRMESVDYTVQPAGTELTVVDHAVRAALGQRIGDRIAVDFPNQPTRFDLLDVARVDYGRHRTILEGAGLTDFGSEGRVYTPFVATLDKHTGELLELRYDLLQEDEATVAER